jgi:hypothetical protein
MCIPKKVGWIGAAETTEAEAACGPANDDPGDASKASNKTGKSLRMILLVSYLASIIYLPGNLRQKHERRGSCKNCHAFDFETHI